MEKQYTPDEAGLELKLHPMTVRNYIRIGKIEATVHGRKYLISQSSIEEYLKNATYKPNGFKTQKINTES